MPYAVDDSRWPFVFARAIPFDPVALDVGYRRLEALLARKQAFVVLLDMRGASSSPARRRAFMEFGERHAEAVRCYLAAAALVAASPIERGFITAGLWLRTPPFPMRVFASSSEAEAWLHAEFSHIIAAKQS